MSRPAASRPHSHDHDHAPVGVVNSLILMSAWLRLAVALSLSGLIWALVLWAMQ